MKGSRGNDCWEGEQLPDQWLSCSICLERFEEESNEEQMGHHAKMLDTAFGKAA